MAYDNANGKGIFIGVGAECDTRELINRIADNVDRRVCPSIIRDIRASKLDYDEMAQLTLNTMRNTTACLLQSFDQQPVERIISHLVYMSILNYIRSAVSDDSTVAALMGNIDISQLEQSVESELREMIR